MREQTDKLGRGLNLLAVLTTFAICTLLITQSIDYYVFKHRPMMCGSPVLAVRDTVTTLLPIFFAVPFLLIHAARLTIGDTYISTNFLRIGIALWLGAAIYVSR